MTPVTTLAHFFKEIEKEPSHLNLDLIQRTLDKHKSFAWEQEPHTGDTALHIAARFNTSEHAKIVSLLASKLYSIARKNKAGFTPLHEASRKGHDLVVEALVAACNRWGNYLLGMLIPYGLPDIDVLVGNDTYGSRDALALAIESRNARTIHFLLEGHAVLCPRNVSLIQPYASYVSWNLCTDITKLLIEARKKHQKNTTGSTTAELTLSEANARSALEKAWGHENNPMALLDKGLNFTLGMNGGTLTNTPTKAALEAMDEDTLRLVQECLGKAWLASGDEVFTVLRKIVVEPGETLSAMALRILEFSYEHGMNFAAQDCFGNTVWHLEVHQNKQSLLNWLAAHPKAKLSINKRNHAGWTPLGRAIQTNRPEMIQFLLSADAAIGARSNDGMTPVHLAVILGDQKILRHLLEVGAQKNVQAQKEIISPSSETLLLINDMNSAGKTPLHLCMEKPEPVALPLARLLFSFGADPNACCREFRRTPWNMATEQQYRQVLALFDEHRPTCCAFLIVPDLMTRLRAIQIDTYMPEEQPAFKLEDMRTLVETIEHIALKFQVQVVVYSHISQVPQGSVLYKSRAYGTEVRQLLYHEGYFFPLRAKTSVEIQAERVYRTEEILKTIPLSEGSAAYVLSEQVMFYLDRRQNCYATPQWNLTSKSMDYLRQIGLTENIPRLLNTPLYFTKLRRLSRLLSHQHIEISPIDANSYWQGTKLWWNGVHAHQETIEHSTLYKALTWGRLGLVGLSVLMGAGPAAAVTVMFVTGAKQEGVTVVFWGGEKVYLGAQSFTDTYLPAYCSQAVQKAARGIKSTAQWTLWGMNIADCVMNPVTRLSTFVISTATLESTRALTNDRTVQTVAYVAAKAGVQYTAQAIVHGAQFLKNPELVKERRKWQRNEAVQTWKGLAGTGIRSYIENYFEQMDAIEDAIGNSRLLKPMARLHNWWTESYHLSAFHEVQVWMSKQDQSLIDRLEEALLKMVPTHPHYRLVREYVIKQRAASLVGQGLPEQAKALEEQRQQIETTLKEHFKEENAERALGPAAIQATLDLATTSQKGIDQLQLQLNHWNKRIEALSKQIAQEISKPTPLSVNSGAIRAWQLELQEVRRNKWEIFFKLKDAKGTLSQAQTKLQILRETPEQTQSRQWQAQTVKDLVAHYEFAKIRYIKRLEEVLTLQKEAQEAYERTPLGKKEVAFNEACIGYDEAAPGTEQEETAKARYLASKEALADQHDSLSRSELLQKTADAERFRAQRTAFQLQGQLQAKKDAYSIAQIEEAFAKKFLKLVKNSPQVSAESIVAAHYDRERSIEAVVEDILKTLAFIGCLDPADEKEISVATSRLQSAGGAEMEHRPKSLANCIREIHGFSKEERIRRAEQVAAQKETATKALAAEIATLTPQVALYTQAAETEKASYEQMFPEDKTFAIQFKEHSEQFTKNLTEGKKKNQEVIAQEKQRLTQYQKLFTNMVTVLQQYQPPPPKKSFLRRIWPMVRGAGVQLGLGLLTGNAYLVGQFVVFSVNFHRNLEKGRSPFAALSKAGVTILPGLMHYTPEALGTLRDLAPNLIGGVHALKHGDIQGFALEMVLGVAHVHRLLPEQIIAIKVAAAGMNKDAQGILYTMVGATLQKGADSLKPHLQPAADKLNQLLNTPPNSQIASLSTIGMEPSIPTETNFFLSEETTVKEIHWEDFMTSLESTANAAHHDPSLPVKTGLQQAPALSAEVHSLHPVTQLLLTEVPAPPVPAPVNKKEEPPQKKPTNVTMPTKREHTVHPVITELLSGTPTANIVRSPTNHAPLATPSTLNPKAPVFALQEHKNTQATSLHTVTQELLEGTTATNIASGPSNHVPVSIPQELNLAAPVFVPMSQASTQQPYLHPLTQQLLTGAQTKEITNPIHNPAQITKPVTQALLKGTLVGNLLEPELIVADKPKTLLFSPHAPVPRTNSTTATASGQVAQKGFWQAFSRGHQQMHFIRDVDAHPSQVAFAQGGAKPIPAQTPGAWSLVWDAALQNDPLAQQQLRGYFPGVAAFTDGMKEFQESPTGQTLDTIAKPIAKAGLMVMASEAIALNAAGKSMLNAYGNYKTIAKASSMADGLRLKAELAFKEAGFLDRSGKLTALALKGGDLLKRGKELQNPSVIKELTKNGQPMVNWGKYTTKDIQFRGHKYQIHFYFNHVTKEVNYTHVDFKVNRPIEFFEKPTTNVPSIPKPKL